MRVPASIISTFTYRSSLRQRKARQALLLTGWMLAAVGCRPETESVAAEKQRDPAAEAQGPKDLAGARVEVVVVQPSERNLELNLPGEVEAHRDALLAAPLGGYIESVHAAKGDRVKHGQALVSVDTSTHSARLARVQTELDSASRELARAESLAGAIPAAELDSARDRVTQIEANKRELTLNVSRSVVRAPFAGYITDLDAEVGEVAAPGAPLLRLVQLQPVDVTVSLSDRDISLATVGSPAVVTMDARAGQFEGKITEIARAADLKTRAFEVVIELPNADEQLLPGMIANVTLKTGPATTRAPSGASGDGERPDAQAPGSIVIAQDWLVTRPDGVGVFVVKDGKAAWRPVRVGSVLRKQVSIEEGLADGDVLIIVGHRDLVEGDKVLVQRKGRCCVNGRAIFSE